MYRVYLNDILQDEKDVIGIAEGAEFSIVREFGIGNSEQILRDKTDVQLKFTGAAYQLFCTQRAENYCATITIRIEFSCDGSWETIFEGVINQKNVELNFNKCIANVTAIRDNSFSGLVRDYLNTDIGLYNTKTINCDDLSLISQTYTMFDDPTDPTSTKTITAFDVLDVLQYYLNYITNNQIEIRSNYLTGTELGAVRFAITTGYNMHNTAGNYDQIFPMLSFQKVFDELRKKLKIYMGIEYDGDTPYLRIEKESYFFDDTDEVLIIAELPADVLEKLDASLFYNQINVGSSTTELQNDAVPDYPQTRFLAWNEESYTNCGGCGGEKDSTLDLVSDFIIDSNLIYEALQEAAASDYANDDAVFMFHYYIDAGERIALVTNDDLYGKDIYNEEITNDLVVEKWGATQCIAQSRSGSSAFRVSSSEKSTFIDVNDSGSLFADFDIDFEIKNYFSGNTIYDISNSVINNTITNNTGFTIPVLNPGTEDVSGFSAPRSGYYNLGANATFMLCNKAAFWNNPYNYEYRIEIRVYSDSSYSTLLQSYQTVKKVGYPDLFVGYYSMFDDHTLEVSTGSIYMNLGNVAVVKFGFYATLEDSFDYVLINDGQHNHCYDNASFYLIDDEFSCENTEDSTSTLPFQLEFKYPICYSDFKTMKENKRGYITVNGQPYWIREIKYRPGKLSDLVLLGANTICQTC